MSAPPMPATEKGRAGVQDYRWLIFAILSAVAAAFVGIFGKLGMDKLDATLATAVRSVVMTVFLIGVAVVTGVGGKVSTVRGWPLVAIVLSGVAGAVSWLFYFRAIQLGTVAQVAPIDKLSMPFAVLLAVLILRERPTAVNWVGIALVVAGAYLAALPRAS
jgi:bacterial/archaeal transporter family protein